MSRFDAPMGTPDKLCLVDRADLEASICTTAKAIGDRSHDDAIAPHSAGAGAMQRRGTALPRPGILAPYMHGLGREHQVPMLAR